MAQVGLVKRVQLATKILTGLFTNPDAATAAYGLLSGVFPAGNGPMPERGTKEILEGYSSMPWLRAVEARISQAVASTQWTLYAGTGKNNKPPKTIQRAMFLDRQRMIRRDIDHGTMRQIEEHVMLDALNQANDYLVGQELLLSTQIHLDLVGEAFWIKERNGLGVPSGFWPIPPHWVWRTPTPENPFYRVQFNAWHGEIPDTEIIWFRQPDPANPYGRGSGIARSLADELETDEFAARHTRMTFINRARPDFIVWPEETKSDVGTLSPENATRLGERWRNEHQGFWNAAKPFFATRKIGVKELGMSFQDLQMVPLREFERNTIRQVFGIPPEMLGIIEPGAARATIETGEYIFEKHVIQPRREFLRMYLQERLVPEYDERLVIDFVSTIAQDATHRLEMAKAAPWSMKVDEWRELQGLEPLEGKKGQGFMVPTAMEPMKDISIPRPPDIVAQPFGGGGGKKPPKAPVRGIDFSFGADALTAEWGDALTACKDAGDADLEDFITRAASDEDDAPELTRRVDRMERSIRRLVASQLAELRDLTPLDALRRTLATGSVEEAVSAVPVGLWADGLVPPTKTWMRDAYLVGSIHAREQLPARTSQDDDPFNTPNPEALRWASVRAAALLVDVSAATIAAVREAIVLAIQQGWGAERAARVVYEIIGLTAAQASAVVRFAERLGATGELTDAQLAARVARYASAQRRARALTIARTELMTAANTGQQRLWEDAVTAGLLRADRVRRKWIANEDELLERLCEALADETVKLNEPFSDGTFMPPRHPNCRCSMALVIAQDLRMASPEIKQQTIAEAVAAGMAPLHEAISALAKAQAQVTVHVPAPIVTVNMPSGKTVRTIERDADGLATRLVEEVG